MKHSQLVFGLFLLLLGEFASARIIVDDSAPEPTPSRPAIDVPAPAGAGEGASAAAPVQDSLRFLNKDLLHGLLQSIEKGAGVHWQSPEAAAPILFRFTDLSEIKLDSHKSAGETAKSTQRVKLTNDDELPGNIVSLDDKSLTLETWYAGRLSIPRQMIRRITPLTGSDAPLYEGPTGLEGWTAGHMGGGHSWTFRNGALIGSNYGTIGRDVNLPPVSKLEFDCVLRGNSQFSIAIYSDHADNFGNCYMLQLGTGYTELQRYSRNTGSNDLGSTQIQNAMRRDRSHIEIRTSKEKKSIWLLIDGKIIKQWTDTAEFNGAGGAILFSCQPGTFVKITNIRVSSWDGKFEDQSGTDTHSEQDAVKLQNQDKVTGHLLSIQDGKMKFASEYAELNIPVERIQQLDLASLHSGQAPLQPTDVRAFLEGGGMITMQLLQWDGRSSSGTSPNFGQASFVPAAFSRILFNLPAQQASSDSDDLGDSTSPDVSEHE